MIRNNPNSHRPRNNRENGNRPGNHFDRRPENWKIPDWIDDDTKIIDEAKKVSGKIRNERNSKTQIRRFYDEFCSSYDEFSNKESDDFENEKRGIFKLKMIKPKLHYQKERKVLRQKLCDFIEQLIEWVSDYEKDNNRFEKYKKEFKDKIEDERKLEERVKKEVIKDRIKRAKMCFEAVYGFHGEGK